MRFGPHFAGLTCFSCGSPHDSAVLQTICTRCRLPLRVDYRLARGALDLRKVRARAPSLWRYEEVLPLRALDAVTLGEGFTPPQSFHVIRQSDGSPWFSLNRAAPISIPTLNASTLLF